MKPSLRPSVLPAALACALTLAAAAWRAPTPPLPAFALAAPRSTNSQAAPVVTRSPAQRGLPAGVDLTTAPPAPPTALVNAPSSAPLAATATTTCLIATSRVCGELLPAGGVSEHAATLAELADGRIAAAWFGGSREGAADVRIYFSTGNVNTGNGTTWSPPSAIADRAAVLAGSGHLVRKLGNPVLAARPDGRLQLFFVSVGLGGWAGSQLNLSTSTDSGSQWSPPRRLVTSPFLNISTLVRTPPLELADGGLGLPVYHEFLSKHGEWLRLAADDRIVDKTRMVEPVAALQPAVAALDGQRALALLRDAGPGAGRIRAATSSDVGAHWQTGAALPLANPNSSVALLRLIDGRLLLAANPATGRNVLGLWLSDDEGKRWRLAREVERADDDAQAEFSYPALLRARDGSIHLAYTWRRERIKHLHFTADWLTKAGR
jgi:predicted neuraminidase